jgi:hypothetical protein
MTIFRVGKRYRTGRAPQSADQLAGYHDCAGNLRRLLRAPSGEDGLQDGAISGAGTSESRWDGRTAASWGFEENLANARRIADCTGLLLQADADTGYGNAVNVYFVVRAFEKAGMAAS